MTIFDRYPVRQSIEKGDDKLRPPKLKKYIFEKFYTQKK